MSKLFRLVLAGLLVQASLASAFAQFGGRGQGGFGGGISSSMLLQQKSVQDELKLTDDQKTKLKEAGDKMRASFGGGGGGGNRTEAEREEARKKFEEVRKANDKAVAEILTADQAKRVKEITLQQAGPMALANEETAKAVGLTADQQAKVKEISTGLADETRKLFQGGGGGGNFQEGREKMQAARKAAADKVVALLTDEQKKTWEGLVGKKFEGEITFGGGRGPGGRPQGARPQGDTEKK